MRHRRLRVEKCGSCKMNLIYLNTEQNGTSELNGRPFLGVFCRLLHDDLHQLCSGFGNRFAVSGSCHLLTSLRHLSRLWIIAGLLYPDGATDPITDII